MMDFLSPMSGKGLIFSYVDDVIINNVKFNGLNDKEIELIDVNNFNRN